MEDEGGKRFGDCLTEESPVIEHRVLSFSGLELKNGTLIYLSSYQDNKKSRVIPANAY